MKIIDSKKILNYEISSIVAGIATLDDEWNDTNVKSPFSRIFYIKSGTAYLFYKNEKIQMTADNVYLIPAETEFSYSGVKDSFCEKIFFHVSFSSDEYYDLLSEFNGIFSLPTEPETIEYLFAEYENGDLLNTLKTKSFLYNTIINFIEKYNFELHNKEYSVFVEKAIDYIKKNLNVNLSLNEIADSVSMPLNSLRKKFKQEVEVTLGQYVDNLIMNKAKYLLIHSNCSIREISDELGFSDQFYFCRRFKQMNNKTPSQYRKENDLFMFV